MVRVHAGAALAGRLGPLIAVVQPAGPSAEQRARTRTLQHLLLPLLLLLLLPLPLLLLLLPPQLQWLQPLTRPLLMCTRAGVHAQRKERAQPAGHGAAGVCYGGAAGAFAVLSRRDGCACTCVRRAARVPHMRGCVCAAPHARSPPPLHSFSTRTHTHAHQHPHPHPHTCTPTPTHTHTHSHTPCGAGAVCGHTPGGQGRTRHARVHAGRRVRHAARRAGVRAGQQGRGGGGASGGGAARVREPAGGRPHHGVRACVFGCLFVVCVCACACACDVWQAVCSSLNSSDST